MEILERYVQRDHPSGTTEEFYDIFSRLVIEDNRQMPTNVDQALTLHAQLLPYVN